MIKFENLDVFGWETAIRGMRNPMNSWKKSDSTIDKEINGKEIGWLGKNDLKLMKDLVKAGTDHAKFMRMIVITMDITAPLYWWSQYDTYKVGTVANSCSKMHKIHAKEFTLDDFSIEHLIEGSKEIFDDILERLNDARDCYVNYEKYKEEKDIIEGVSKKDVWWQMILLLPSSYNQKRTVQLNYAVARAIYHARKDHKLDEWRNFCDLLETLPYSELITM